MVFNLSDKTPMMLKAPSDKILQLIFSDIQNINMNKSDIDENPDNIKSITSESTRVPTLHPFPLLHSLGINTDFDTNESQLINLMSELVALFNK